MIAADQLTTLERTLVCNVCHGHLAADGDDLVCARCGRRFQRNRHGYYELMAAHGDVDTAHIDTTTEEYAACQHECAPNLYHSYVKPYLEQVPAKRILDVGCGVGAEVDLLRRDGYEAYGIDLPGLSRFWAREGRDSTYFFGADATRTPFPDDSFDVVYSLGVIEHIGTLTGHCTLGPGYRAQRQRYAHEVLRVVRPGGRVLIACPNKHFPVDIQHGPTDDASGPRPLREFIFQRTGLNVHRPWGPYHLLSYPEMKHHFVRRAGARRFHPLPLTGYFGFGRFQQGFLRPFARTASVYVDHLPQLLRPTFMNPYVLVEIRK